MRHLLFFLLLSIQAQAQIPTSEEIIKWRTQARRVTIVRDIYGVPHIYGKTDADAVFGLLYAQCEENFPRVEQNYLEMMGRLSEVKGKEEIYNDLEMRLLYDSAGAVRDYNASPEWFKKLLNAFADGVNFYLYTHSDVKPAALTRFQPWFPLIYTDGSIAPTQTGGLTMKDIRNLYGGADKATSYNDRLVPPSEPTGSNGFAFAPSRTASGHSILYINPHVTFYFRSEVQMVSEEGLNAYGAVTWGQFFVYQGFNEHCGWMHTSSYADVADLYKEKIFRAGNGYSYLFEGKVRPVLARKQVIRYKTPEGMESQTFTTYRTGHGPVMGSRDGQWLSLRENNRSLASLLQSWLRTKANGFEAYKKVMGMMANNSNNTVFADDKGNIAYWHGNFMPRRNPKFDYSLPLDGTRKETDWQGMHTLNEIVHVYNPSSGYIQNCNSTPFTSSGPSSPKASDYPTYMAPDGQNYRALNAMRLIENTSALTIERVISEIGYNRYLAAFDVLLPALLDALQSAPDSLKSPMEPARLLLSNWNKVPDTGSVASTLAIEWAYKMDAFSTPPATPYQSTDFVARVRSMVANSTTADRIRVMQEVMRDLVSRFGTWQVSWGTVNRYQRSSGRFDDSQPSMPVAQAAGTWGSIPSFATVRSPQNKKRYGVSGNSFIACVEFGPKVKARSIITGGQSFDPSSPHYIDQAQGYIEGKFKEVFFYKDEVLKHASETYRPGE